MKASQNPKLLTGARRTGPLSAFSLLELMVVIAIIGLLAAIGLPAIRGMTKSNAMIAANRQLLDDISFARRRAISDHTTVYMIFVPPYVVTYGPTNGDPVVAKQFTNLWGLQYNSYALLSLRSVGEQPGRSTPRYLTPWRTLPNGVFIATNKFARYQSALPLPSRQFPTLNTVPFPLATNAVNTNNVLPYIGFDYLGRLVTQLDEYIPLARGSIFPGRDAFGNFTATPADVVESPANNSINMSNVVHIDWLTGRARIERQDVQ
jgi:prepilin-type N-terminal cleavage/methylation domain-containing protein